MSEAQSANAGKQILLHVCCGPCAEWPVVSLKDENYEITAFFYNPNIHPDVERKRRRDNAAALMDIYGISFLVDEAYMEDVWHAKAWESGYASRCEMCYSIRMLRVAQEAKNLGIPSFTTSLLVSPYQNHEAVIAAAQEAAKATGVTFVYRDYRPGYREGQKMAREHGLYRQKYCGCILSLEESVYRDTIYRSFPGSEGDTSNVL